METKPVLLSTGKVPSRIVPFHETLQGRRLAESIFTHLEWIQYLILLLRAPSTIARGYIVELRLELILNALILSHKGLEPIGSELPCLLVALIWSIQIVVIGLVLALVSQS
jgi:hypothetical protein